MTLRVSAFRLCCAFALLACSSARANDPKGIEFFEKHIRPVLVESCYSCHSAEAAAAKKLRGGLYLDSRDGLLTGGDSGPAIVPGKPGESLLLKTLHYTGDTKMPPKGKFPANVIADFETWIAQGAIDPRNKAVAKQKGLTIEEGKQFWSYQQLKRPTVPASNGANPIDGFINERLAAAGLKPAPAADPVVLIRRVHFDLTGLPPTPEEVDAFVKDYAAAPQAAYERLVDRLLASPQFGERWGRHWLDLARYADSLTLRGFVLKEAWRYRDYVIDSFNRDLPFDQFLREQVAGDLLPADSLEQRRRQLAATTFLTLGNTNLEEQDKKQLVMDVVDEQLDVIGKAILGQTITCARCHDHKFDPIPTKDYYALAGILRNTRTLQHSNVSKWLEMPLPAPPETEKKVKEHEEAVAAMQKEIAAMRSVASAKKVDTKKAHAVAIAELPGIVVDDSKAIKVGSWKESTITGSYVGKGYLHDENQDKGNKTITFQPEIPKTGRFEVRIAYSAGTNRAKQVPITLFCADGEKTVTIDQTKPPEIDGLFHSLGDHKFDSNGQGYVLVSNEDTKGTVTVDAVVFIPIESLAEQKDKPKNTAATPDEATAAKLKDLEAKLKQMQAGGPPRDMVMSVQEEGKIEDCKVHIRGNVHNQGELAPRGFLKVAMTGEVPKLRADQSGRVELANWLASADNPLTARVFANRTWHWLLGSGLVRTTDNFGVTGEKPSHPELLEYLSGRFIDDGWSVKKLVRLIVLSDAYRRSSSADPKALAADPENRLFGHANRRRLDAECIRDAILQASGQLKLDAGGRTFGELNADYNFKHTDTRRSVYSPVFRNSLPELFEAFDFADPSVCTGKRNVSTVAPQALFLMNNPFVMAQAKAAAQRLLDDKELDDPARVVKAFRVTLGRAPTAGEAELATNYLKEAIDSKSRLDQWASFVQTLFASIDFRYAD